jgi:hypothetical protein
MMPEQRREASLAAILAIAVAALGVPALVRLFSSFTGDEEVLANGLPGSATITSLESTGWFYNRYYPIVRFSLNVEAGGAAYPVEIKQAVDPDRLQRLASGDVIGIRVDRQNHKKVVIDWRAPASITDANATRSEKQGAAKNPRWFYRPARKITPTLLGVIVLVLSFFFAALSLEERSYEKEGVIVKGTVIGRSGKGKWAYKFTTRDGQLLNGTSEVLSATSSRLKEGGTVEIQYLPGSPQTNRIPGQRAGYAAWTIMAVIGCASGVVLLFIGRRRRQAHREL